MLQDDFKAAVLEQLEAFLLDYESDEELTEDEWWEKFKEYV